MWIGGNVIPSMAYRESPVWIPAPSPSGFNPSDYGTVNQYLLADDITGGDGDPVTNWPANIGTDGTPSGSPILRTGVNGINGKNAVEFDGASWFTVSPGLPIRTMFAVVKGGGSGVAGTFGNVSSWNNDFNKRMGFIFSDPDSWFTGNGEDRILISMVNGVVTLVHDPGAREVVSGQRGDAYDGSGDIIIGAANTAGWNWDGLISMWLAYSDAPDMATVQAAILAQYP